MRIPRTFGQYVAVDSPVHRLDAKTKMGLVAAYTVGLFTVERFVGLGIAAALIFLVMLVACVPSRLALRGIRAVAMILTFTVLAHALRWNPATESLLRLGPIAVDAGGLRTGLFFAARIMLLVVGTSLLTLTTTPVQLTDGLERLMRPLSRFGFPAGDVAMMLTVALRFIPTTAEEADKIIVAQMARGARFDEGGLLRRARAYVPVLIPLFVNLFRRADELAVAMESRCYHGGPGRTRLTPARMLMRDWAVLCCGTAALVALGIFA
ncbi:MAG: energy-coupling factor transporter transmembrane protein EcfT [Coriobacteriia bacterium]|nr:energy-coupling factor transporter transmembrane protein EcfT [Coriobacteriia bacterium]MBN2823277.1 energy-coupling factor transporter transmembrane protein EcfT [Coriobacteriia bacterium]